MKKIIIIIVADIVVIGAGLIIVYIPKLNYPADFHVDRACINQLNEMYGPDPGFI